MNPYQKAIKQKKFEGLKIEISPMEDREEMEQTAANGDGAPVILDDPSMTPDVGQEMAGPAEVADPSVMPVGDEPAGEYMAEVQPEEMNAEEVFGAAVPEGRPQSLKDRVMQSMKRKK